ncbi:cystathionine beta-lyase [Candidatus Curculioniphilus buchneri]|uniref:cystathionine beta-lyase n=1 Tax=Candidatus Curculioniphilus buchneri TaxID=690594 RepID=UPI00376F14B1
MRSKKIETLLVSTGRKKSFTHGSINPVIQRASSLVFDSVQKKKELDSDHAKQELFYGRRGTLTHFALQQAMVELEGGVGCALYPCGMAAISIAMLAFLSAGDHILMTDSAYESTQKFCRYILQKMNVTTTWFHPLIGADIGNLIRDNTRIIMLESPGSMTMDIQDIPAIVQAVRIKNKNIVIILDNTWSAGILLKAFDFGVDISLQSGTKYLIGHSDAMIGIAVANLRCWNQLREQSYLMGQVVDADTAYMAIRGLRTLSVRLKQHGKNGLQIAKWLEKRPEVESVNHPALPNFKGHNLFVRDFIGASGLFSFILKRRLNDIQLARYLDHFTYFSLAYSWGGYESLILTSQPEELAKIRPAGSVNLTGTLVRLHIGLENVDDLVKDLAAGFTRISAYKNK